MPKPDSKPDSNFCPGTVGTMKVVAKMCDLSGNVIDPYLVVSNDAVFDGSDTGTAIL